MYACKYIKMYHSKNLKKQNYQLKKYEILGKEKQNPQFDDWKRIWGLEDQL